MVLNQILEERALSSKEVKKLIKQKDDKIRNHVRIMKEEEEDRSFGILFDSDN